MYHKVINSELVIKLELSNVVLSAT